jgi:hypothetical protein
MTKFCEHERKVFTCSWIFVNTRRTFSCLDKILRTWEFLHMVNFSCLNKILRMWEENFYLWVNIRLKFCLCSNSFCYIYAIIFHMCSILFHIWSKFYSYSNNFYSQIKFSHVINNLLSLIFKTFHKQKKNKIIPQKFSHFTHTKHSPKRPQINNRLQQIQNPFKPFAKITVDKSRFVCEKDTRQSVWFFLGD